MLGQLQLFIYFVLTFFLSFYLLFYSLQSNNCWELFKRSRNISHFQPNYMMFFFTKQLQIYLNCCCINSVFQRKSLTCWLFKNSQVILRLNLQYFTWVLYFIFAVYIPLLIDMWMVWNELKLTFGNLSYHINIRSLLSGTTFSEKSE